MLENQLLTNGNKADNLSNLSIGRNLGIIPDLQQVQLKSEPQQSAPAILNNNISQLTNDNISNNCNSISNQVDNIEYSNDNASTNKNNNTKVNENINAKENEKETNDEKVKEVPLHVELRR